MARHESAREDLLREATALVERIELRTIGYELGASGSRSDSVLAAEVPIVVGFRASGAASFFFGDDPVYQFNTDGQLRRAYCDGRLFKAVRGRLVSLQRERSETAVQLISRELTDIEQNAFVLQMQQRLRGLAGGLEERLFTVVGQVPAGTDVLGRVRAWLASHDGLPIARTPRV